MQETIDTRQPSHVEAEVQKAYQEMFPEGDRGFIPMIFKWAVAWFGGKYRDYQPVDAHYHDLEHTLQVMIMGIDRLIIAIFPAEPGDRPLENHRDKTTVAFGKHLLVSLLHLRLDMGRLPGINRFLHSKHSDVF